MASKKTAERLDKVVDKIVNLIPSILALVSYGFLAYQHNIRHPAIDYAPSRFEIKKGQVTDPYKPKNTYAVIVTGFPGKSRFISRYQDNLDSNLKQEVLKLDTQRTIETTFLSYKEVADGNALEGKLHNKLEELSDQITKNDAFIFAYSGHGYLIGDEGGLGLGDKSGFVSATGLRYYLDNIPSKYQIVVLMSCFSGNLAEELQEKNRIVISSASKNHSSATWIFSKKEGFIFSVLFEDSPKADRDKNGKISLEESFIYAAENDWCTNYTNVFLQSPRQRPQLFSEGIDPNAVYLLDNGGK